MAGAKEAHTEPASELTEIVTQARPKNLLNPLAKQEATPSPIPNRGPFRLRSVGATNQNRSLGDKQLDNSKVDTLVSPLRRPSGDRRHLTPVP
jgi:hypothetical protein